MKVVYRSSGAIYFASLISLMFSNPASAGCNRDDVEYYLGKGFNNDQITTLCGDSSVPVSKTPKTEQQLISPAMDENALFLSRAIKAQEISLSSDNLQYTQKICMEYGEEDLFGFTEKVCPDVTYIISLKGLEVLDSGMKYGFYGTSEVRIKSSVIQREIIGELKDKKKEERKLIIEKFEKFEKDEETAIPIRDDFSLEKVGKVLSEVSQ